MAWVKNTDGKPDAIFTISLIAFGLVCLKFLVSGAAIAIGDFSLNAGAVGADDIAALLAPTLGTYAARRYTDKKFETEAMYGSVEEPGVPDGE